MVTIRRVVATFAFHYRRSCEVTDYVTITFSYRQNFLDAKSVVLKTVKHWHSLPVRALEYTAEGKTSAVVRDFYQDPLVLRGKDWKIK